MALPGLVGGCGALVSGQNDIRSAQGQSCILDSLHGLAGAGAFNPECRGLARRGQPQDPGLPAHGRAGVAASGALKTLNLEHCGRARRGQPRDPGLPAHGRAGVAAAGTLTLNPDYCGLVRRGQPRDPGLPAHGRAGVAAAGAVHARALRGARGAPARGLGGPELLLARGHGLALPGAPLPFNASALAASIYVQPLVVLLVIILPYLSVVGIQRLSCACSSTVAFQW